MPKRTATISPPAENVVSENSGEQEEVKTNDLLALDDLRDLIYLGSLSELVKIGNYEFEVFTLNTAEQRDIMKRIMADGNATERMLDIKPLTMAYSAKFVNKVPLESLSKLPDSTDPIERRADVMMSLQAVVVERLYQVYEKLIERSTKEIGIEDLKG